MSDVRDRFVVFDRFEMPNLWADAQGREPRTLNQGPALRRRLVAGVVAFAVFAAAGVFAWRILAPGSTGIEPAGRLYKDAAGWSIRVPDGWHVRRFEISRGNRTVRGAQFSNVQLPDPQLVHGTPPQPSSDVLPSNGVALIVAQTSRPPKAGTPEGHLPLSLNQFWQGSALPGQPILEGLSFQTHGASFIATVKIGSSAYTNSNLSLVRRSVASFRIGVPEPSPIKTPSPPTIAPVPAGWIRHTDEAGVSIDTPSAWHFNSNPAPALVAPNMLFAVGSGPVPSGGSCAPTAALKALPPNGALFELTEYGSVDEPYTFPPRPARFDLGPLTGPVECWGVKTYYVAFEDGGRYFDARAVFGPHAPASLRSAVERSLDTLHVKPLPQSEQPAAACAHGDWISCPEAAWVYGVINQAGVFHLGHNGVQAILGLSAHRSFAIWTTRGKMPTGQCRVFASTDVCYAGDRLVWAVHGLLVWVEPAASPYASLKTNPALPTASTIEALVAASQTIGFPNR